MNNNYEITGTFFKFLFQIAIDNYRNSDMPLYQNTMSKIIKCIDVGYLPLRKFTLLQIENILQYCEYIECGDELSNAKLRVISNYIVEYKESYLLLK